MLQYKVIALSESALLLSFGNEINLALHEQVMSAKQLIEASPFEGFTETFPAYNSLAVFYNPLKVVKKVQTLAATVEMEIRKILVAEKSKFKQSDNQTPIIIPVCYDEAFGTDLKELSTTLRLSTKEIIHLHCSKTYKVFMIGFTPGFPYMGIVDEKLISSRKAQPRVKVEAGSVAVAGSQTGIYPLATPGGWNIIGRTPLKIFDKERTNPFLLKAGDEVKFVRITKEEFYQTFPTIVNPGGSLKQKIDKKFIHKQIIHIEQCGFLTTIQDTGRTGYLHYGVSKGGAMDEYAAKLTNILTGNDENAAVLEITQSPHRFLFLKDTLSAFAGGGLQPAVNNHFIPLCQPVFIRQGTIVELKQQIPGYRLYMAVAGGLKGDVFLNSVSTDLLVQAGGYQGRSLKKNDRLESNTALSHFQKKLMNVLQKGATLQFNTKTNLFQTDIIRVMHGTEWDDLTGESKVKINTLKFVISPQSSRMGYRLRGDQLQTNGSYDIISSPVTQGTVQLTSSGELIILMADGQTAGGYARILQVIAADLPMLAQKKPGDFIQFQIVSLQEAEELYLKQAEELNKMKQVIASAGGP